jgi:hypothetical protein
MSSFINYIFPTDLMGRKLSTFKAIVTGNATIEFIGKTPLRRTPGDTTYMGHQ